MRYLIGNLTESSNDTIKFVFHVKALQSEQQHQYRFALHRYILGVDVSVYINFLLFYKNFQEVFSVLFFFCWDTAEISLII